MLVLVQHRLEEFLSDHTAAVKFITAHPEIASLTTLSLINILKSIIAKLEAEKSDPSFLTDSAQSSCDAQHSQSPFPGDEFSSFEFEDDACPTPCASMPMRAHSAHVETPKSPEQELVKLIKEFLAQSK